MRHSVPSISIRLVAEPTFSSKIDVATLSLRNHFGTPTAKLESRFRTLPLQETQDPPTQPLIFTARLNRIFEL